MALTVGEDSYVTLAEADDYFGGRPFSTAWDDATDGDKEKSLKMAVRHLDLSYTWNGTPTDEDQTLSWPRSGLRTRNGADQDEDEIPRDVKEAQMELAFQWLGNDQLTPATDAWTAADPRMTNGLLKREKLGDLEREYADPLALGFSAGILAAFKKVYPLVDLLVRPWVRSTSSSAFRPIIS